MSRLDDIIGISLVAQQKKAEVVAVVLDVIGAPKHRDNCAALQAWQNQKTRIGGMYVGRDPMDCFEYLCDCGTDKVITIIDKIKSL